MELPVRNGSFLPTVKCTICAADIELSAVAQHICPVAPSVAENLPILNPVSTHVYQPQHDHSRGASSHRINRPILPKIDSSVTSRSGLLPSEAASIAHDLGLPSPVGAGHRSPRRSRSRSRKAHMPRPPSPEGPVAQDCAFPPFPMKPKRSQADKEVHSHKSHSANRSGTSARMYQHSSSQSASSSIYSTTSGPPRRRTSNTSSSQRSRQGTIDDNMSLPSTAPSSPRQSLQSPRSREQSIDHSQQPPALFHSYSNTPSEPNSSASLMPPTPSWPLEMGEPSPKIVLSPNSETGWTPTESAIPEEQAIDFEINEQPKELRNKGETFDKIVSQDRLLSVTDMFDNPPREPLYKAKRPAPLMQPQRSVTDDPNMPLSARAAPPFTNNGGLTRTLTNLFGRRRTQSSTSKTMPLPSFDSPRMRALAPDPPERPKRNEGMWNTAHSAEDAAHHPASESHSPSESLLLPSKDVTTTDSASTTEEVTQVRTNKTQNAQEPEGFDFRFGANQSPNHERQVDSGEGEASNAEYDHSHDIPVISDPLPPEEDLRRVSIDSASSYGSVGFSNRTVSSRSDRPLSSDAKEKTYSVLQLNPTTLTTRDLAVPPIQQFDQIVPDSPTDPLYNAGKLSPVPDSQDTRWLHSEESEQQPPSILPPPVDEPIDQGITRQVRPVTPAGNRGRCRGCSNFIISGQKSVASADGRLTGRYHKECFVCKACREPFATADFYVLDDQPYCAHHYHSLNNTLCAGCGKGIEGQYFETFDSSGSSSKKLHPKCLQCSTCKVQLNEDYFEFYGRVYCERDAFRAASGPPRRANDTLPSRPSPLNREYVHSEEHRFKGRFPERRTTRLIMT